MRWLKFILLFLIINTPILSFNLLCQSAHALHRQGDQNYLNEDYTQAEINYKKALDQSASSALHFNLGNATFNQERFEEAIEHFDAAAHLANNPLDQSNALYNKGLSQINMQQLEEAINSFKESIKLAPQNEQAKHNLALAREMLRQQKKQEQQNQQDQQQQNENQDNQDNQEQQSENQQNQDKQEQQNQQDQQQQNENQENRDSQENENQEQQDSLNQNQSNQNSASFDSTRLNKEGLDSLDAMKLLQIINSEELKVQEKLKKFKGSNQKPDKDW